MLCYLSRDMNIHTYYHNENVCFGNNLAGLLCVYEGDGTFYLELLIKEKGILFSPSGPHVPFYLKKLRFGRGNGIWQT